MEAVLTRLRSLTPDELREEFARADVKCGPITPTTRATFERKLARALAGTAHPSAEPNSSTSVGISDSANSTADHAASVAAVAPTFAATSRKLTENSCEESDFGYGMGLNPPDEEEVLAKNSKSCAEVNNSQNRTETPSKQAQVSPTFFGVCPPWDDVLSRYGKFHLLIVSQCCSSVLKVDIRNHVNVFFAMQT